MKKLICVCGAVALAISLSACGRNTEIKTYDKGKDVGIDVKAELGANEIEEKLKFDKNDVIIDGLHIGMLQEEVKQLFGEPNRVETNESETFAFGDHVDYYYDDMHLTFYDIYEKGNLTLGSVSIIGETIKLKNGLKVGVPSTTVLSSYYNDAQNRILGKDKKWGELLYGEYLYTQEQGYKLADQYEQSGVYNIDSNLINYMCYLPKGDCVETYDLVFYLDENNCVKNISWSVGKIN